METKKSLRRKEDWHSFLQSNSARATDPQQSIGHRFCKKKLHRSLPENVRTQQHYTIFFYDVNAKVNFELGRKDKIYLSAFKGRDNGSYTGPNSLNYDIGFGNRRRPCDGPTYLETLYLLTLPLF